MTQNFKNLKVYQDALSLSRAIYIRFKDVKGSLRTKEQIISSASSIGANLAEMASMSSKPQQKQKLTVCIGECNETEHWLEFYKGIELKDEEYNEYLGRVVNLRKGLFNLKKAIESEI